MLSKLLIKTQVVEFLLNMLLIDKANHVEKEGSFKKENNLLKISEVINKKN